MNDASERPSEKSAEMLVAGKLFGAERYLLKKLLGQGGMGLVWLAQDLRLREPVALKFLPPQIAFDPAAIEDLRKETLRSRRLSHPNIVRIHDLCETKGEPTFIAMEYVDGPNLHYLRAHRPSKVLTWKFLMPLLRQLCEALEYAHGERILHRDLKPANLMQDSNGRLKLADFGLACVIHDSFARVSGHVPTHGTLPYMSPQQVNGEKPAVGDDIYSLGATLYELLTSQPPFHSGDLAYQLSHNRPQDMRERLADLELNNDIPTEVSAMVMACLAKDPEQRPQSAKAIWDCLSQADFTKPAVPGAAKIPTAAIEPSAPQPPVAPLTADSASAPDSQTSDVDQAFDSVALPEGLVLMEPEQTAAPENVPRPGRKRAVLGIGIAASILLALPIYIWLARSTMNDRGKASTPIASMPSPETIRSEFRELFNGRDLTGWEGDPSLWSVQDGLIVGNFRGQAASHSMCLIWRGAPVENFELHVAFRFYGGNSGVFYRARELGEFNMGGYQYEIMPGGTGNLIEVGTDRTRREFVHRSKEEYSSEIAPILDTGGWNELVIIARANHLTQKLNGAVVADVVDSEAERQLGWGSLGFELARMTQTLIQFKDVRIKKLGK